MPTHSNCMVFKRVRAFELFVLFRTSEDMQYCVCTGVSNSG